MTMSTIGIILFLFGVFATGVANSVFERLAKFLVKAGAKVRRGQTDKLTTGIAVVVTLLAVSGAWCLLFPVPLLMMFQGVEIVGLVNWDVFFRYFAQNLVGMLLLNMIYAQVSNANLYSMLKSAFGKETKPADQAS